MNINLITQLNKNELVRGLPILKKDKICEACLSNGKADKNIFLKQKFNFYLKTS